VTRAVRYAGLLAGLVVLNFALPRALPGDPLDGSAAGGMSSATATLPAAAQAQLRAYYHLDQPILGQFTAYLSDLAHGNLGVSISRGTPVAQLIGERLPWTASLVLAAVVIAAVGGSLLGGLLAWKGGRLDRAAVSAAAAVAALPELLIGIGLALVFAVTLRWFPLQGGQASFPESGGVNAFALLADRLLHLALPGLTLTLAGLAAFLLLARGAVAQVRGAPYIRVARAKGLPETTIAMRHAAPNAALPLLSYSATRLAQAVGGATLGGAIVVERLYSIPGIGLLAFQSIQARDYPVLQAVFLLASLSILVVNLSADVLCQALERRRAA